MSQKDHLIAARAGITTSLEFVSIFILGTIFAACFPEDDILAVVFVIITVIFVAYRNY